MGLNNKAMKAQLKAVKLELDDKGRVNDKIFDYGFLKKDTFEAVDGEVYRLEDIENVCFVFHNRCLTLVDTSGELHDILGGKFPESQIKLIRDMPMTLSALSAVFEELFPDYRNQLFEDELTERTMVDMSIVDWPEKGIVPIFPGFEAMYHEKLQNRLDECGFQGKSYPRNEVMDEVLSNKIKRNIRNEFREWVESHTWDGIPRLRRWFVDVLGATAPLLREELGPEAESKYIGDVTQAWFLGAIKRMYSPAVHDVVPVFIGEQGIGKASALRYTAGMDRWYTSTTESIENKEQYLNATRGHVLVEWDEAKPIKDSNQDALKSFLSESTDQLRKKYERHEGQYPRRCIIAASTNNSDIFRDPTGARRFYPFYCDPSIATKPIPQNRRLPKYQREVEQLWAEALHLYNNGHQFGHMVPKETRRLAKMMQDFCTRENPGVTAINQWLDDPYNGKTEVGSLISRNIVYQEVFGAHTHTVDRSLETAWRDWCDGTKQWVRCNRETMKVDGKTYRNVYVRKYLPNQVPATIPTLNLVDGSEDEEDDLDPVIIMRNLAREHDLEKGGILPTVFCEPAVLDILEDAGLIYNVGSRMEPEFHITEIL